MPLEFSTIWLILKSLSSEYFEQYTYEVHMANTNTIERLYAHMIDSTQSTRHADQGSTCPAMKGSTYPGLSSGMLMTLTHTQDQF